MKTLLFAASLAALGLASPASAQPVTARATVSTAGLDLGTAAGQHALDLRILHAASALCGTPSPADQRGRAGFDTCRAQARAAALADRDRAVALARRESTGIVASR
ncbi:MAG TPA: UrcA family protein [Sphingomonas sp.]|nr:UrcA family protein [Sphingomonas sp.]